MNALSPEESRAKVEDLRRRVQELSRSAAADLQKSNRKRNVLLIGGAALTVTMLTSLSLLTSMAFRLDAQALTEIGRHEMQDNLPESRIAVRDYLTSRAPEFTAQFIGSVMGMVPQIRPLVVQELDERLRLLTVDFEEQLIQLLESSVQSTKSDLDNNFPDMSDAEKFDLLVSTVAAQFNDKMQTLLRELYPQYSREMQRVNGYLTSLRTKDSALLTQKERTEKEIIETLLRIIALEQQEYPDALTR